MQKRNRKVTINIFSPNRIFLSQVQNERESFPPPKLAPSFKVRGKNVAKMYVLSVPLSVPELVNTQQYSI